ncbi:MAG: heat-inducible transcription repressor HrcA [Candidatus Marinimicrobia bacterium]|nr:heat-inducible transcription repressor HrcA [Candidatus Neomarinimicrobiota bacterium]
MTKPVEPLTTLTSREQAILRAAVTRYIQTTYPVSSGQIHKSFISHISTATIRNTLHELCDKGYLLQPFTSSGRIPSDRGYRFFVDTLTPEIVFRDELTGLIKNELQEATSDINIIMDKTSALLSKTTEELSVFIAPKFRSEKLVKVELILLEQKRLLIVLEISSRIIKTVLLEIDIYIKESRIDLVRSILNERLSGVTLNEIAGTINERFSDLSDNLIINRLVEKADTIFNIDGQISAKLSGTYHLLRKPDFADLNILSQIVSQLENGTIIAHIAEHRRENSGVVVTIGLQNAEAQLKDFSVITKDYRIGNSNGLMAVIDPKRRDYSKSVSILNCVADTVTKIYDNERSHE